MSLAIFRNVLKVVLQQKKFYLQRVKYCSETVARFPRVYKGNLQTMNLETPLFKNLFTPELRCLIDIFSKYNYELRIAGGAVRDLLMDKLPSDVDFATVATPDQMIEMFTKERIRMFNGKGIKHGTVTARINDKENFEVTTLRIDVSTDGRRAEVAYTTDWKIDANRRDLTINAMFLGMDGTIYDYFDGIGDLKQRKVQFVGDPVERIKEDYLRILRYFRFYGRISEKPDNHLAETLQAIRDNREGLKIISGERIWLELKKILCGNHARAIIPTMLEAGLAPFIGLPSNIDVDEYRKVCDNSEGLDPLPTTRLSALFSNEAQVYEMNDRLKLSTDELRVMLFIVEFRHLDDGGDTIKFFKNLMVDTEGHPPKKIERMCELLKYKGEKHLSKNPSIWIPPDFPVSGSDILKHNVIRGPKMFMVLHELRQMWKKSDFQMDKSELLENVEDIISRLPEQSTKTTKTTKTKKYKRKE